MISGIDGLIPKLPMRRMSITDDRPLHLRRAVPPQPDGFEGAS